MHNNPKEKKCTFALETSVKFRRLDWQMGATIYIYIFFGNTRCVHLYFHLEDGKGKAIPLQALTDPEGSSRLRLPDYKTIGT
jgi:hypothetical protein